MGSRGLWLPMPWRGCCARSRPCRCRRRRWARRVYFGRASAIRWLWRADFHIMLLIQPVRFRLAGSRRFGDYRLSWKNPRAGNGRRRAGGRQQTFGFGCALAALLLFAVWADELLRVGRFEAFATLAASHFYLTHRQCSFCCWLISFSIALLAGRVNTLSLRERQQFGLGHPPLFKKLA